MLRRLLLPSIMLTAVGALFLGIVYPLAMTGVAQVVTPHKADGSFITRNGQDVGSSLIGQNFLNNKGNPDPKYFQPRPSAAGTGYDPLASGATNLGPSDPRLVGFIPGFNTVDLNGKVSKTNPFASKDDPDCVPTDDTGAAVIAPAAGQKYAKNKDGSYVCLSSTVPERASAYRDLNGLSTTTKIPVDAVTASASGLDPGISVANARLQVDRVAKARNLSTATVRKLVDDHTEGRDLGLFGEKSVNVLELNLALDALHA